MLNKNQGDVLDMPADDGTTKPVRIDGLLDNSVFQSGLLLSEDHFLELHPTQEGYQFFLIETPPGKEGGGAVAAQHGAGRPRFRGRADGGAVAVVPGVENTYLSTFQALGGLGLILGSLGLAVVLLRSVWERRGELALLRALGFRRLTLVLAGAGGERLSAAAGPGGRHGFRAGGGGAAPGPAGGGDAVAGPGGRVGGDGRRSAWRSARSRRSGALRAPLVAALRRE